LPERCRQRAWLIQNVPKILALDDRMRIRFQP
jgi:hypothetical protein